MSPFALLGLATDADERTIKRTYAQRLRQTRPEDDPQGFQQLHAAYLAALEHCRRHTSPPNDVPKKVESAVSISSETPQAEHATSAVASGREPTVVIFDVDDFCARTFELASTGDQEQMQAWLGARSELWSLQLKAQTGRYLMQQLHRHAPPMPASCLDTLLHFFDLDHVLAGHDPLALLKLQRRAQLEWELQPEHRVALESRLGIEHHAGRCEADGILRQLSQPFRWSQVLLTGINPFRSSTIADFVERLAGSHTDDLPPSINRDQLHFWLAAAAPGRADNPRLILGAARSALLLLVALLVTLLSVVSNGATAIQPALLTSSLLMAPSLLWAVVMLFLRLHRWQGQPEHLPARWPWFCHFLVPLLCGSGLVLNHWQGDSLVAYAILLTAAWLALQRYWRRNGKGKLVKPNSVRVFFFLLIPIAHVMTNANLQSLVPSAATVLASVALVAWAADFWKQRHHLRIAAR